MLALLVGGMLLARAPVHAQQPDEAALIDQLQKEGQLEEMPPEMVRSLVGDDPRAMQALPPEVRRKVGTVERREGRSPLLRSKAGLSDLTIEDQVQSLGSVSWTGELGFNPKRAFAHPAGDVNNDGVNDWVYRYNVADDRTADLSDRTSKTLLRFGGDDFSGQFYDTVYDGALLNAGNLVGSDHADALQLFEGGTQGIEVRRGADEGYGPVVATRLDSVGSDLGQFNLELAYSSAPIDLNGDGYDDIIFSSTAQEVTVLFGAEKPADLTIKRYSPSFSGTQSFAYEASDIDEDGSNELVRLAGDTQADGAVTVTVYEIDDTRSLTSEQTFEINTLRSGGTGAASVSEEVTVANLDGVGFQELIISDAGALVYTAENGTYDSQPLEYETDLINPLGDVNDDGRFDFGNSRYLFLGPENLSNGVDSLEVDTEQDPSQFLFRLEIQYPMGDLDGDDRADYIVQLSDNGAIGNRLLGVANDGTVERTDFRFEEGAYQRKNVLQTANVGDWDGDGSDDVALLRSDGRVEIYYGDPTTSISPDLTIDRSDTYSFGGADVTGMASGDFTGDGNPNLAVGWPSKTETVAVYEAGEGTSSIHTVGVGDLGLDPANLRDANAIRATIANVGDVNDDGTEDFAVALPTDFNTETTQQAFLFLGQDPISDQVDVTIDYRDEASGAQIYILGSEIQSLGDINEDGIDDFAVGDVQGFTSNLQGRIYVHYGQEGDAGSLDFSTPDETITPQIGQDEFIQWFPWGLTTGDFNDDGTPDLAAKPLRHTNSAFSDGVEAIRVYHGGTGFDGTPDEKFHIPSAPIDPVFGGEEYMSYSNGTITTVPQQSGPDRILFETGGFSTTNALLFADEGSGFEPTTVLRAPDQNAPLGTSYRAINWPTPTSSAVGDFAGGDQTRLLLPQPKSPNFQGAPSYTFQLGTGSEEEEPVASASQSVDASSDAGSTITFGETGTSVTFSDSTEGSGDVTVNRFAGAPTGAAGIEGNTSEYRIEIIAGGTLSVGDSSQVRFDVSALEGIANPSAVKIYSRDLGGLAAFEALETTYDADENELVAYVSEFSEFAFGSETEPLFSYPDQVTVEASRTFGDASGPGDYRLVALPGAVDRSLSEAIGGAAGTEWQAYWDDGTDFVKHDGSDTFRFQAGNGFWVTSTQEWTAEDTFQTVSLTEDQTTTVPLNGEWTIVSNPFDRNVPWVEVLGESGLDEALWRYDSEEGYVREDTMRSASGGTAYYVFNGADLEELEIPYPTAAESGEKSTAEPSVMELGPLLSVSARPAEEGGSASTVEVGLGEKRGIVGPPGRFEPVSLRLAPTSGERPLMVARRPATEGGQTFTVHLTSRVDGPVELSAEDLDAVEGQSAALLHPSTGRTYDLRRKETVQIEPDGESAELRLAVGTEAYVEGEAEEVLPKEVSLTTYPNPVRQQGTLEYGLPEEAEVTLRVYDVLGREVATLEQGRKKAGRHTVRLETDQLASGVYFGRLQAGGRTLTKKITVVR